MEEEKPTPMGAQAMGVSCIVPAYNEAQRIAEVLQTLEADRTLAEIIVVDDGSTDQTAAVVAPFVARDARFRLLRLPLNQGKAAAMVAGAACASSDVILFLDADLRGLRLQLGAEPGVVLRLARLGEQGDPRGGDLVEQLLRQLDAVSLLDRAQVRHPLVRRVLYDLGLALEQAQAQQAVVVGRLLLRRNGKPGVIRIERLGHRIPPL